MIPRLVLSLHYWNCNSFDLLLLICNNLLQTQELRIHFLFSLSIFLGRWGSEVSSNRDLLRARVTIRSQLRRNSLYDRVYIHWRLWRCYFCYGYAFINRSDLASLRILPMSLAQCDWLFVCAIVQGFAYGLLDTLNKHFQNTLHITRTRSSGLQAAYFGYVQFVFTHSRPFEHVQ